MSAILKFDFKKREQLRFSEVNYLNYTKKDKILHVTSTFLPKQGETRTSHGPIPHPLRLIRTYWAKIEKVDIFATIRTYWAEVLKGPQLAEI